MAKIMNRFFQLHKDVNGFPTYLRTLLVSGDFIYLQAGIEQTFIVPNDSNLVIFSKESGNTVFFLIDDGSGAITLPPVGTSLPNSLIDINVVGVSVDGGQTIHLMSTLDTYIKINYYQDRTIQ